VDGPGGRPALALPNSTHVAKCEPHRPDVEAALAKHFGRPVPVRLVVESGQVAAVAREPAEELIDPADIVDDPAPGRSPLDLVTQAFPGAEMVDES
jgi:hypothetical protein